MEQGVPRRAIIAVALLFACVEAGPCMAQSFDKQEAMAIPAGRAGSSRMLKGEPPAPRQFDEDPNK